MAVMEEMLNTLQRIEREIAELRSSGIGCSSEDKAALNRTELAEFLGVSKSFVYDQTRKGEIPHVKVGSKAIYPKAEILRWLQENSSNNKAESNPGSVLQLLS